MWITYPMYYDRNYKRDIHAVLHCYWAVHIFSVRSFFLTLLTHSTLLKFSAHNLSTLKINIFPFVTGWITENSAVERGCFLWNSCFPFDLLVKSFHLLEVFYVSVHYLLSWSEKSSDKWRFNSGFNLGTLYYIILAVELCFKCLQVGTQVSLFAYLLLCYTHLGRRRILLFCVYKSNTLRNYSNEEQYKYTSDNKLMCCDDMQNFFTHSC